MRLALLSLIVLTCCVLTAPALAAKDGPPNAAESSAAPKKTAKGKSPAKPQGGAKQTPDTSGADEPETTKPRRTKPQQDAKKSDFVGPRYDPQADLERANAAEATAPGKSIIQDPARPSQPFVGPTKPGAAKQIPPVPPGAPDVNLPSVAQGQPGFIPDKSPSDLFQHAPTQTPRERYRSLLGPSKLPPGQAPNIIGGEAQNPGSDLLDNQARVVVPDGSIEGSVGTKQFKIRGGIIIFYNGVEITAEDADIDEKGETALLKTNVEVVDPQYDLKTNELRVYFGEKRFEALGFVQFVKNAKPGSAVPDFTQPKKERLRNYFSNQKFELYCNKLYYDWDKKQLTALQGIRIEHPSFSGTMERLDYNDKDKSYLMEGEVALNVNEYDWIFTNKLVDASDEKKVRAVTDQPTKITADKVNYSDDSATAQFYALNGKQVVFDQTERKVTANYIEINDKTKDFYAEGSDTQPAVFDQTNGDWLAQSGMISQQDASDDLKKTLAKPMTAKAKTITFNYDRKRVELRHNVDVSNDTQQLKAGEMIQDDTAKFFLVRDNVFLKTDANTELHAAQVYVDTAHDVYTFVGLVQGKGSGAAAGLPNPAQSNSFGQAANGAFGQQPTGGSQPSGNNAPRVAPGVFQEQR